MKKTDPILDQLIREASFPASKHDEKARLSLCQRISKALVPLFKQWKEAPPTFDVMRKVYDIADKIDLKMILAIDSLIDKELTEFPRSKIYAENLLVKNTESFFCEAVLCLALELREYDEALADQMVDDAVLLDPFAKPMANGAVALHQPRAEAALAAAE